MEESNAPDNLPDPHETAAAADGPPRGAVPADCAANSLPAPLAMRELPYGAWVADWLALLRANDEMRGGMPALLVWLAFVSGLYASLGQSMPLVWLLPILVILPLVPFALTGDRWRHLFPDPVAKIHVDRLVETDLRPPADEARKKALGKIDLPRNLPRLARIIEAVDAYNALVGKVGIALRNRALRDGRTEPDAPPPALLARLRERRAALERAVSLCGSLFEGESRGLPVDDAADGLVDSKLESDREFRDVADDLLEASRRVDTDLELLDDLERGGSAPDPERDRPA